MGCVAKYQIVDGQVNSEIRNGERKFYDPDALGSTVALYNNSQTKTDSFTFWPFGEVRTESGSRSTKYKFVGTSGCRVQADGGVYMRARVLIPKEGRWQTVDPLWPQEQAYPYVGGLPTSRSDPFGLQSGSGFWDFMDRMTNGQWSQIWKCPPVRPKTPEECATDFKCKVSVRGGKGVIGILPGIGKAGNAHWCRACESACDSECCTDSESDDSCFSKCQARRRLCQVRLNWKF